MLKIILLTIFLILIAFGIKKKHALTYLFQLEILCLLLIFFLIQYHELFFGILLICVRACEAVVGLSAIVSLARVTSQLIHS